MTDETSNVELARIMLRRVLRDSRPPESKPTFPDPPKPGLAPKGLAALVPEHLTWVRTKDGSYLATDREVIWRRRKNPSGEGFIYSRAKHGSLRPAAPWTEQPPQAFEPVVQLTPEYVAMLSEKDPDLLQTGDPELLILSGVACEIDEVYLHLSTREHKSITLQREDALLLAYKMIDRYRARPLL